MPNIYEVAKRAGVSITTVSHVYSGQRAVAQATKKHVLDIAKELNYRPHRMARGLATGRSMVLGLCIALKETDTFAQNPYFLEQTSRLSTAAASFGYAFLLIPSLIGQTEEHLKHLLHGIDGAIIIDPIPNDQMINLLLAEDVPMVTIGRYLGLDPITCAENDHARCMANMFKHFKEQGYRKPLLLSVDQDYSYYKDKEDAFCKEAARYGIEPWIVRKADMLENPIYDLTQDILTQDDLPDVVLANTDYQATEILQVARNINIQVPDQLGVVGDGNTVLARNTFPSLTSISVQTKLLGETAVELMIEKINNKCEIDNRTIEARLIKRKSTHRPRHS